MSLTVRMLVESPTKLAKHLGLTKNAIIRWINLNRIPVKHLHAVAQFYSIKEETKLWHLTQGTKSGAKPALSKGRNVLPLALKVVNKELTLQEAAAQANVPEISMKLILTHWSTRLEELIETLEGLERGDISLDTAALQLGLSKPRIHSLRKAYGYAPGTPKTEKTDPRRSAKKQKNRELALLAISGKASATELAEQNNVSVRTIYRAIDELKAGKLQDYTDWPMSFRAARVIEIQKNLPSLTEKWINLAEEMHLLVQKKTKFPLPPAPNEVRGTKVRVLLIALFNGDYTLDELASFRNAEPTVLENLFNQELKQLGTDLADLKRYGVGHEMCAAEVLIWTLGNKRNWKGA